MKAAEFTSLIPTCCAEVLDAMYFTTLLGSHTLAAIPKASHGGSLSYSLRFEGHISGRFGLYLEEGTARTLAANFLAEDEGTLSCPQIGEVAGELANMLCGSVMSQVEGDRKFILSHPQAGPFAPSDGLDDLLVSGLDTDCGPLTIWISVEGDQCHP